MEVRDNSKIYGQCRCCLINGYHRDIMKCYFRGEVREIYFDMFLDCFNLFLSSNPKLSTLICIQCIQRLNDANHFKNMVMESEQCLLRSTGAKDTLFVHVPESDVTVKLEHEVEVKPDPDEEMEEAFEGDNDHQEYIQEYMEEEVIVPIEPPFLAPEDPRLVPGEAQLLARFNKPPTLPNTEALHYLYPKFAYHLMMLKGEIVTSEQIEKLIEKEVDIDKTSPVNSAYISEKVAHVTNSTIILENSNAVPFKSRNKVGYPCFYCKKNFENLDKIKEHQNESHKKSELTKILQTYGAEGLIVYADVTDLKCTICDENMRRIDELKTHLIKVHKKAYYTEFSDRVIPFKLSTNNIFDCQICGFSFETFGSIERHMNIHYRNYVCSKCGTGFATKYRLKVHTKSMHVPGSYPCDKCKKVFQTQQKRKNHEDTVHKMVKRFKCSKCHVRFTEYFQRQKHMVAEHGVAPILYTCKVCDKAFDRRYTLSRHLKRDHLEERNFECEMCSYKCFTKNELRVHMVKHVGERIYECAVCKKSYARKKTLTEHMRIHNNDRRFSCAVCGQAFVQKCSLKGHMKTHHMEYRPV